VTGNGFIVTAFKNTYLSGHITANINDHTSFEINTIKTGNKSPLPKHPNYNQKLLSNDFIDELNKYKTAAFLVIKDGQVFSEHYLNGYHDRSRTNSFSMAKTVTAMMLGIAIEEGHIESLDQPISDFLPEFKDDPLGKSATIGQLAQMNSGYEWDENYYTPFSPTVELLYGDDITQFLLEGHFSTPPGEFWEYSSASTQLMGIFILRALQKAGAADSLSDYLSRKVWQPLEMNDNALWHLDDSSMELVFCCVNTNARNFAKLGVLMMNQGNWNDQQIISTNYVQKMISQVSEMDYDYGLSTWLDYGQEPKFYWFSGHLGQYIINVPKHNLVIVRLGEFTSPEIDPNERGSIARYIRKYYIKNALEMIGE